HGKRRSPQADLIGCYERLFGGPANDEIDIGDLLFGDDAPSFATALAKPPVVEGNGIEPYPRKRLGESRKQHFLDATKAVAENDRGSSPQFAYMVKRCADVAVGLFNIEAF